jgi:hypothetical protein
MIKEALAGFWDFWPGDRLGENGVFFLLRI